MRSEPTVHRPVLWVIPLLMPILTSCAVPTQMRIENANDPRYEDQDVRFRTTYYFRVFSYCKDSNPNVPAIDSLYRFRMTGKAHSLTTQVHFESGTLAASEIDPFGSSVVYDEHNKQFYFKSQSESREEGQRERHLQDLNRLMRQYEAIPRATTQAPAPAPPAPSSASQQDDFAGARTALMDVIKQRIESLRDPVVVPAAAGAASAAKGPVADVEKVTQATAQCLQAQRGFQILGPEGWRTFRQDERLLLAMSSSGKPLISTMQEISGRVLNSQPIEAELLLPLVREDLRISRAERELEKFVTADPDRGAALLSAAIEQLAAKEVAK